MTKKIPKQHTTTSFFTAPSVQYLFAARNALHRAIVVSNRHGNYQLYAVDFNSGFTNRITNAKHGALFGSISPDGRSLYILNDANGAEHGHFLSIPFEGEISTNITPGLKPYFSYSVSASDDEKTLCFVAATEGKNRVFAVKERGGTHEACKIYNTANSLSEPVCSPDGVLVCVAETNSKTKKSSLVFLATDKEKIRCTYSRAFAAVAPLAFSAKSKNQLLILARAGEWQRPMFYDCAIKQVSELKHPLFRGDVWVLKWDEENNQLLLCDVHNGEQKLYLYHLSTKKLKRIGPKSGSFNFHFGAAARRRDGSIIIRWSDFNNSPRIIAMHAPTYTMWSEVREWSGDISSDYDVKQIYARSSDKKMVHAWIVRPRDAKQRIPFVIDIHGGPHGVALNEFSPEALSWLYAGFGYCAVNYRGSIGFGKQFERKIYGNPGHWETEDVVAVRDWLVKNNYADPQKITLYGWSWGGYVTLMALGKYPTLWASGIAGAAIADYVTQYKDELAYFQSQDKERFGGTPKTARARYVRSSPITYAKHTQAPLLILHGKNDVRCPPQQIHRFIEALKRNKKRVATLWFESGHTGEFTDTRLRVRLMEKAIRFAKNT